MNPGWHYIYEDCGFISTCWLDSLCQTSHLHCMLWCVHQSKTSNQPAHHVGFRGLSGTCLPSSGSLIQGQITITNLWAHECWSKMFGPGVEYNKSRLLVSQATPGLHYCSPLKPSHKVYPSGPAHAASCWQPLGCSRGPDDWCWCWRGSISDTFALIEAQHPCCLVGMGLKDRLLLHVTRTGHFGSGWAIAVIFVAWANLSIWNRQDRKVGLCHQPEAAQQGAQGQRRQQFPQLRSCHTTFLHSLARMPQLWPHRPRIPWCFAHTCRAYDRENTCKMTDCHCHRNLAACCCSKLINNTITITTAATATSLASHVFWPGISQCSICKLPWFDSSAKGLWEKGKVRWEKEEDLEKCWMNSNKYRAPPQVLFHLFFCEKPLLHLECVLSGSPLHVLDFLLEDRLSKGWCDQEGV